MKCLKMICVAVFAILPAISMFAESSYDITEFYSVTKPSKGSKAIGRYDKVVDVEYLLTPTNANKGKYDVEVKKIGDNLYQVKNTDLCVETRYCHEWASYSKKAVLIIESNYGYTKGKIIFE